MLPSCSTQPAVVPPCVARSSQDHPVLLSAATRTTHCGRHGELQDAEQLPCSPWSTVCCSALERRVEGEAVAGALFMHLCINIHFLLHRTPARSHRRRTVCDSNCSSCVVAECRHGEQIVSRLAGTSSDVSFLCQYWRRFGIDSEKGSEGQVAVNALCVYKRAC